MALNFRPKFNASEITAQIRKRLQQVEQEIIDRLMFIGETFVNNARANGEYNDITGNLRSSIGYVILKNGKQIQDSFPGETTAGKATGKKIASEAAKNFPTGIALIVVAGMDYAGFVESKNKDVLTASSITAETELKASIAELKKALSK